MSYNTELTAQVKKIISLLDLTSLQDTDTPESIRKLCLQAQTALGDVAAVCIYPEFIEIAIAALTKQTIKIATVVNFPHGSADLENTLADINAAIIAGANEIDVVMPYRDYLAGVHHKVENFIRACKKACGANILLKVILETGELKDSDLIYQASRLAIAGGADFIKTSTGKTPVSATLVAAETMLRAIQETGGTVGFKASGGIKTLQQALAYLQLAESILGKAWITPHHFRFGASTLLNELLITVQPLKMRLCKG